ncbi:hypothetical protein AVEN_99923-1 [Araneus ventricosus]|uniref:Uncharacterized protein n=1 Tax=Araneus ventricosus TaxID=182803 RepID=A0A4Y2J3M0_ARAVE|nr:hypothetical protein AVEN_99923-1 [Araneus ventricosus]
MGLQGQTEEKKNKRQSISIPRRHIATKPIEGSNQRDSPAANGDLYVSSNFLIGRAAPWNYRSAEIASKIYSQYLLLTNPSDLNQIRSMRSFALIISNTKCSRLSRPSYTKATQSSRCCGVASIMLHFVQILNFLSPRENLRVFKCPDDKRAKAVWSFLTP